MYPLLYLVVILPVIIYSFAKSWYIRKSYRRSFRIAFFHPYCAAGGGGERVLWQAVSAVHQHYPKLQVFIYTGDNVNREQLIEHVHKNFNVELNGSLELVRLHTRCLLEAKYYPVFTIAGQMLGSIVVALECVLRGCSPHVVIDTMGYSFTYPIFKCIQGCYVISYTHYPTISSDMLLKVSHSLDSFNNRRWIANSKLLTYFKFIYYQCLAQAYRLSGWFADLVMVNSSWTKGHIDNLWKRSESTYLLFPPTDVQAFKSLKLDCSSRNPLQILSVAQFRPEKNHALQLRIFAELMQKLGNKSQASTAKLILVGSVRNVGDEQRVNELRLLAKQLQIENQVFFELNVSFSRLLELMQTSQIGLHTMKDEHFGIGIVECMAAGLVMLAHDSAGPKMDIINNGITGFLATDCEQYVQQILLINRKTEAQLAEIRRAARQSTERFSNDKFEQTFIRLTHRYLSDDREFVRSYRL